MSTGVSSLASSTFNIVLIFLMKEVFVIRPSKVTIK